MSELRFNFVSGDWVIVAPERAKRPEDFKAKKQKEVLPGHVSSCPFCPGNEHLTPPETFRIREGDTWVVRAIPNKFSAVGFEPEIKRERSGVKKSMTGAGMAEVVIDHPLHNTSIAQLPLKNVEDILSAYRNRFIDFYKIDYIEHVVVFKNHGPRAGTSLEHPHSQIIGTPVVPGQVRRRIDEAMRYRDDFGACLYCTIMKDEMKDGTRIIDRNDSFVSFIPYAALSPFHLWIFPRKHAACFSGISDSQLHDLAQILKTTIMRLDIGLGGPDFNYIIRSLSPYEAANRYYHWYLVIVPRVTNPAGFELGTGMHINASLPDDNAKFLREVKLPQ